MQNFSINHYSLVIIDTIDIKLILQNLHHFGSSFHCLQNLSDVKLRVLEGKTYFFSMNIFSFYLFVIREQIFSRKTKGRTTFYWWSCYNKMFIIRSHWAIGSANNFPLMDVLQSTTVFNNPVGTKAKVLQT